MGEIDTKSIESVQTARCFFGEKNDLIKSKSNSYDEFEKEKVLQCLLKDLANCKVQLESKESAHKQALFDLAHYKKTADELSTLLEISDFERDIYINDCKEARKHIDGLESKMKEMSDELLETIQIREQLSHVTVQLNSTQEDLLSAATQLAEAREAKLDDMTKAELIMETALSMEKMKTEEPLRHLSELNETILRLKMAVVEAEIEKCEVLSKKEGELELARESVIEVQERLQSMRKELEMMVTLETQLLERSLLSDLLQAELQQAKELLSSAEGDVFYAISDKNRLKADLELKEKENLDHTRYIRSLEMELNKIKREVEEISKRECEAQVEVAMLKSELHKGRSKIAAAEAAEERAKGDKSGAYLALQQLALEAEEIKKENRRLKEEVSKEDLQIDESNSEADMHVTISLEEYEALVKKTEKADQIPEPENSSEVEILKKELEAATVRMRELRARAEQAGSRAEVAELGKAALEEQIRRWRLQKEKRNSALAALREESISRESYSFKYDEAPKPYQPLSKILNMKF
ncbi:hypothetical protein LguiB_007938 [Lonicera macranthoides]